MLWLLVLNIIILLMIIHFSTRTQIVLYWASYCGWCTRLKSDEWIKFRRMCRLVPTIEIVEIQTDIPGVDVGDIPGVPYIVKYTSHNRTKHIYSGDRTAIDMFKWCLSN